MALSTLPMVARRIAKTIVALEEHAPTGEHNVDELDRVYTDAVRHARGSGVALLGAIAPIIAAFAALALLD